MQVRVGREEERRIKQLITANTWPRRWTGTEDRGDLYTTGVPLPFKVYAKLRVKSPKRVETKLHRRFEKNRLNPNREFFQVQPRVAHAALYEAAGRRGQSRRWVIDVMWVILLVGVAVTVWQVT